ncbi:MAG: ABC transporter substrate-binding protein [Alphaproteobacteria bacterium]|nr:ABC transporter substrate-binding protein [Alphaproteobacteria bacterium]
MITISNSLRTTALAAATLAAFTATASAQGFECPRKGGDFVFALEAKVATLDQHATNAAAPRNVTMNIFESLLTRDEGMNPMLELAESVSESPDKLTYSFKIRQGAKFHNGADLTSADVLASFERYKRVGIDRSIFDVIEKWEAPDPATFTVTLKQARPTFMETFSAFTTPIVIIPKEHKDAAPNQLPIIGSGPFQLVEFVGDSHIKIKRFDGYKADTRHKDVMGFGGTKTACLDTVTFRMMTEPAARIAALEAGEVHGVEDVPTLMQKRLAGSSAIKLVRLDSFWLHVTYPNFSFPPTDNPKVRQAVQAALDMEELMEAASDGAFKLHHALQFNGSAYYSDVGKELYNQKNKEKAKRLLQEAGYKGEKMILMTNRDYKSMYDTAVVMAEQLKAVGINAELLVLDWPAALDKSMKDNTGWNWFFTGWITVTASGGQQSLRFLVEPTNVHKPKDNKTNPEFKKAFDEAAIGATLAERKAAFERGQRIAYDDVMVIPMGTMPKVQGLRANVENFKPYYIPRMSNVWLKN